MIQISRLEKELLLKKGCKHGSDIFKTYSGHPKYYLKESEKNLRKLNEVKKATISKPE